MDSDTKERLFDDIDTLSRRAFKRPRYTNTTALRDHYRQYIAALALECNNTTSGSTSGSSGNGNIGGGGSGGSGGSGSSGVSWERYAESIHHMLHDWYVLWVGKGYARVKGVLITMVNATSNQDLRVTKTPLNLEVDVPAVSSAVRPCGGGSGLNGWESGSTMTLLFGVKGSVNSGEEADDAEELSSGGGTGGSKLGVKLTTNLFTFKLFANGAALLLPTSATVVSISSRRQFHDFTELTIVVADDGHS